MSRVRRVRLHPPCGRIDLFPNTDGIPALVWSRRDIRVKDSPLSTRQELEVSA